MDIWQVDFTTSNNEDWTDVVPVLDASGQPFDVTGAELVMLVKDATGNATRLTLTNSNGLLTVSGGAATAASILVPASQMAPLHGLYRHDLLIKRNGRTTKAWAGTLRVTQGVS